MQEEVNYNIVIGHGFNKTNTEENMEENAKTTSTVHWWGADIVAAINGRAYRQVKIDKVVNGFVIEIGCKKFVCEKWDVLAKKLAEYWADPVAAEKKYCAKK